MVSEIRTRDSEGDSRGAWVAAYRGGSILAFDMHTVPPLDDLNSSNAKRNSPYSPKYYHDVEPGLRPTLALRRAI